MVAAEPLDDARMCLRHDLDRRCDERHRDGGHDDGDDECFHDPSRLAGNQGGCPIDLEHLDPLPDGEHTVAVVGAG